MSEHNYFFLIPNILSRLGLTAFERSVYMAIKETTGEDGKCIKSNATLAKMAGLSVDSLMRTLKKLAEPNVIIKKPLISTKHRFSDSGDRDTNEIQIIDIWTDNTIICEIKGGRTQPYKEEPINKNPIKKKTTTPTPSKKKVVVDVVNLDVLKKAEIEAAESLKACVDRDAYKDRQRKTINEKNTYYTDIQWGIDWIIPKETYEYLIHTHGINYFRAQLNYMANFQNEFDQGKGKKGVDKPETFLKLACDKNYAKVSGNKLGDK
tara:strand:+ start:549 stop:1340 length:792 start_codon:yes stop_codon:yes gene_type:complete